MNLQNIHKSKVVSRIIIVLIVIIASLVIFGFGVNVGYKKAIFSHRLGDNFERNFMGRFEQNHFGDKFGEFGKFPGDTPFPGGHGAVGEIVSLNYPNIIVAGPDNLEKTIVVNNETTFRQFRDSIKFEDLEAGQFIVVLGNPNDNGEISAKLIRVVPPPPTPSAVDDISPATATN